MSEVKIPEGYKQTEVGVIPEDWEVTTIGDFSPLQRGFDLPTTQVEAGEYPVVYSNGILRTHKDFQVNGAGIVTGRSGTIGKVHYVERDFWPHNTTLWVTSFGNSNVKFVYYLFNSIGFERFKSGSGVPTLNRNDAHSFKIVVPSEIKEQTAIATALSDVDNLIGSLEKLIVKKEAIKTATMQQLLTGKTRLPEFATRDDDSVKGFKQTELGLIPEDWQVVQMGDIGKFGRGRVISNREIDRSITDSYPVYSSQTSNDGIMGYIDTFDFEGEYITWTTDGVNAGKVFYRNGQFNCTNVCGSIKVYNQDTNFIALAMSIRARKYVSTNLANPKLMNGVAKKVLISTPTLIEEQTAIATILSDMDSEIQALQKRLDKTRDIKQGMMQQLLTGKVRLISSDSPSTHPSADSSDCLA